MFLKKTHLTIKQLDDLKVGRVLSRLIRIIKYSFPDISKLYINVLNEITEYKLALLKTPNKVYKK